LATARLYLGLTCPQGTRSAQGARHRSKTRIGAALPWPHLPARDAFGPRRAPSLEDSRRRGFTLASLARKGRVRPKARAIARRLATARLYLGLTCPQGTRSAQGARHRSKTRDGAALPWPHLPARDAFGPRCAPSLEDSRRRGFTLASLARKGRVRPKVRAIARRLATARLYLGLTCPQGTRSAQGARHRSKTRDGAALPWPHLPARDAFGPRCAPSLEDSRRRGFTLASLARKGRVRPKAR